ncbi:Peptidase inhibitor I78 family [Microdochium nivale]|nr:Peptidase inhibitor I78 family [Microdochium nivale]
MPLVTPQNNSDNPTELWATKLVGKTLSDDSHSETNFCKKDLPESHRIIHPGSMVTMDFRPDRLNVHVKEDGTVAKVTHS